MVAEKPDHVMQDAREATLGRGETFIESRDREWTTSAKKRTEGGQNSRCHRTGNRHIKESPRARMLLGFWVNVMVYHLVGTPLT